MFLLFMLGLLSAVYIVSFKHILLFVFLSYPFQLVWIGPTTDPTNFWLYLLVYAILH